MQTDVRHQFSPSKGYPMEQISHTETHRILDTPVPSEQMTKHSHACVVFNLLELLDSRERPLVTATMLATCLALWSKLQLAVFRLN